MNRRSFLARTGALGALALAGCTANGTDGTPDDPGSDGDTPTDTPGDTPTPTPGPALEASSLSVVGASQASRGETTDVTFDADAGTVSIQGTIQGSDGCKTAALGSVEYDAGTDTLAVDVITEDREGTDACTQALVYIDYEVTVTFDGGLPGTVTVSHDGESLASAAVESTRPTATADGTPSVRDASLSVIDVSQGDPRETANVSFDTDANTVSLTGTIQGSDACKTAALGSVEYDADSDTLSVDVVTENREGTEDQACAEVLIYIDYEATIEFANDLPRVVEVAHDSQGILSGAHDSASAGDGGGESIS